MSMLASLGQFGLALGQGFQQKQEELKKEAEKKAQQEREYRRQDTADRQAAESHDLSMQTNRQSLEQNKITFDQEQQVHQIKMDAFRRQEVLRKGLGAVMAARKAGDNASAFAGLAATTKQLTDTTIEFDRDPVTGNILVDKDGKARAYVLDANGQRTGTGQLLSVDEGVRNVYALADPVADQKRILDAEQKAAELAAEHANRIAEINATGKFTLGAAQLGAWSRQYVADTNAGARIYDSTLDAATAEGKGQSGNGNGNGKGTRKLNYNGPSFTPPPQQFIPFINSASSQHGIDAALIMAMMGTESSHNPNATSPVGAAGLMQILPSTAKGLGVPANKIYDPQTNIFYGTQYYRQMLDQFKDPALALAAYNAGPGMVAAAIKANQAKGLPTDVGSLNLPSETRDYVQRVISRYQQASAAYANSQTGNPALDVQVNNANVIAQNVTPVHDKWAKALGIGAKDGDETTLTAVQLKIRAALLAAMQNASVALTNMVQAKDRQTKGVYYDKAHAALATTLEQYVGLRKIAAEQMAHQIVAEMSGHESLTELAIRQKFGYPQPAPADPNAEPPTSTAKPPAKKTAATAPNPLYTLPAAGGTTQATVVNPAMAGKYRLGVNPPQVKPGDVDQRAIRGALQ